MLIDWTAAGVIIAAVTGIGGYVRFLIAGIEKKIAGLDERLIAATDDRHAIRDAANEYKLTAAQQFATIAYVNRGHEQILAVLARMEGRQDAMLQLIRNGGSGK